MRIKLNLNRSFVDTEGNELPDGPQSKFLARLLAASPTGDALKLWDWAVALSKTGELELDESDAETLTKFIRETQGTTALAKAQLQQALIEARVKPCESKECAGGA